jgi:transposase InsO family protein
MAHQNTSDLITELLFIAHTVRYWLELLAVQWMYIKAASPWKNGYIELFNGKMQYEVLNREVLDTLLGARKFLQSAYGEIIIIYDCIAR